MLFMLKEPSCFATCFLKKRHKSRDNPATVVADLRAGTQAVYWGINSGGKTGYTVRLVD
ncbi:hypothetical protein GKQ23_05355 [Erwinia sp. E602]|uniref:hypothetical protein n=1 Tax=Erwinia sp. E602 TaxID=2675378 RepID=UPI001BAA4E5E|nr:hypothetical protein [Erwinia sp. E602]QUG74466.1 hypothetical protein GKQ23_05355 [Erwinia sp. E602]